MKKVELTALVIQGIDGREQRVNIQDELANLVYMQGQSIAECELGRRMYQAGRTAEGNLNPELSREVNLTAEDVGILRRVAGQFPYVIREALLKALEDIE